jgi:hypothetical protein
VGSISSVLILFFNRPFLWHCFDWVDTAARINEYQGSPHGRRATGTSHWQPRSYYHKWKDNVTYKARFGLDSGFIAFLAASGTNSYWSSASSCVFYNSYVCASHSDLLLFRQMWEYHEGITSCNSCFPYMFGTASNKLVANELSVHYRRFGLLAMVMSSFLVGMLPWKCLCPWLLRCMSQGLWADYLETQCFVTLRLALSFGTVTCRILNRIRCQMTDLLSRIVELFEKLSHLTGQEIPFLCGIWTFITTRDLKLSHLRWWRPMSSDMEHWVVWEVGTNI